MISWSSPVARDYAVNQFSSSPDGRWIAFTSRELAPGSSSDTQCFLLDRSTGETTLLSHAAGNPDLGGDGWCSGPRVAPDGSTVIFTTQSTNLVAGVIDDNEEFDVYGFDVATGVLTLLSHVAGAPTTTANGRSWAEAIDPTGTKALFTSEATDLVSGFVAGSPEARNIYLNDGGANSLITRNPDTVAGGGDDDPYSAGVQRFGDQGPAGVRGRQSGLQRLQRRRRPLSLRHRRRHTRSDQLDRRRRLHHGQRLVGKRDHGRRRVTHRLLQRGLRPDRRCDPRQRLRRGLPP